MCHTRPLPAQMMLFPPLEHTQHQMRISSVVAKVPKFIRNFDGRTSRRHDRRTLKPARATRDLALNYSILKSDAGTEDTPALTR